MGGFATSESARSRFGVALTAAVATAGAYGWLLNLQTQGRSAAALNMPDMGMTDMGKYWAFPVLQATGLTGLVYAYLSVVLGLQQSGRLARRSPATYRLINRIHRQTSLTVIGLVLVHMTATVLDAMGNTWQTVLIPGAVAETGWPEAVWGFNAGIIAFYTLLLVAPTFYIRRTIGMRRWQFLHRFVLMFYGLSVSHALILGLDVSHYAWIRPTVWLAQIPLLAMLIVRVHGAARASSRFSQARPIAVAGRYTVIAVSGAAIVAVVLIVTTGHSGFIQTV
jgi:methionine sulfoxide reductase heme-binding subunit